ncbi:head GIN domain-containing protein [Piscirickettsia salmonis]|uniref:head GIN domain-containing protein n=1 Tax=Piscirickettsia salmonis TaxID=1238 RepID=UPI003EBA2E80
MKQIKQKISILLLLNFTLISTSLAATSHMTGYFENVTNNSSIDIVIKQGNKPYIQIINAADSMLPFIKTDVEKNTLMISTKPNAPWDAFKHTKINVYTPHVTAIKNSSSGKIKIYYADKLTAVTLSGSGDIKGKNIKAEKLAVKLTGSGDINLSGILKVQAIDQQGTGNVELSNIYQNALTITHSGSGDTKLKGRINHLNINNKGSGEIDTRDLKAKQVTVSFSGSGNINLYAQNSLNAELSGSGNINVEGHPQHISQKTRGTGHIKL